MEELEEKIVLVVDGCNVLGAASSRFDFLDEMDFKQQRQWLINNIRRFVKKNILGVSPNEVFLVFDGVFAEEKRVDEKINVIFTGEEPADDKIVRIIKYLIIKYLEKRRREKKIFLVTSDQGLTKEVKKIEGGEFIVITDSNQFIDWIMLLSENENMQKE